MKKNNKYFYLLISSYLVLEVLFGPLSVLVLSLVDLENPLNQYGDLILEKSSSLGNVILAGELMLLIICFYWLLKNKLTINYQGVYKGLLAILIIAQIFTIYFASSISSIGF